MAKKLRGAFGANWKTSSLAIAQLIVVLGTATVAFLDDDPSTNVQTELVITSIIIAMQGIFSRDWDTSSKDSGVS